MSKERHIMLDLETLGTRTGSVLTALGAVEFGAEGITREFYRRIDGTSCAEIGMTIDLETVNWWLLQNDEARAEIAKPGEALPVVLESFADWLPENPCIWGNGSDFDNAHLAEAYRRLGSVVPWKFWNNRCYRTLKNTVGRGVKMKRSGTHHHAVDDARDQAQHLLDIYEHCDPLEIF